MSPAPRSDWRPGAPLETLKKRAQLLKGLRAFFDARGVMEVDPPLLSRAAAPDVHLRSLSVEVQRPGVGSERRWLPTSPEYPIKRLLCAGLGDCYALGHVFRDGDESSRHQPEFMMLEWYRLGLDLDAIMDETAALLGEMLPGWRVERHRYDELFAEFAGIKEAYEAPASVFRQAMEAAGKSVAGVDAEDRLLWRQLVLTEIIEPRLAERELVFVWGWPVEEAALAALSADGRMALRFEVYAGGLELANGYQELREAGAYRRRFTAWNAERRARGLPEMPVDEALLAALEDSGGLPACAGVALGVDRLLMAQLGENDIRRVVPFAFGEA
ncbi:EF-P lysine aminoacylase EpmA [Sulfurivirga sp.]|uniref:EF-P lysine aminoacylase EpmA n=1 Tax=Sulfurivirga sp. TaxID=2614236 RepID=UPI0025E2F448|nr:EF-P lysine aminoacylase EpmA [Sulfurivirga sp.]